MSSTFFKKSTALAYVPFWLFDYRKQDSNSDPEAFALLLLTSLFSTGPGLFIVHTSVTIRSFVQSCTPLLHNFVIFRKMA